MHGRATAVTPELPATVRIDLLGPLRLQVDGEASEVPGTRRRAVLALLALSEGRSVTVDELLNAVWPSEVPESGRRALHSHVSRVRGHLGPAADRLVREGDSYRLVLLPGELDLVEVRQLAGRSEQVAAGEAVGLLREALGQWRGTALDEFADVAPLAAAGVGLEELRRDLQDRLLEARLASGPDAALVHDAARAAAADPLRERTQLVLARVLAAEGRSAEALRVVHELRRRLADETGLDPSPAVAALETEIATGMLAPRATAGRPAGRARPQSPLVGRQRERAQLTQLVAGERLVTLVGPGGVGKTRLTVEVVADLLDEGTREVAFVELAAVDDGSRLPDVLGAALGLRTPDRHDLLTVAIERLAIGTPVVVLDNCEHLLDDCRDLAARLVGMCDGLTVVATSREPLGLAGERVVRLGPLAVPPPGARPEDVAAAPAIIAFRLHAERRDGTFVLSDADLPIVAEIVRRLDGLPLALELAAGRTTSLSVGDLRDRLGRALDLLEAGRASTELRHRTLRSTIEWSYRLLAAPEQRLLRALAQLPSGFGLDAAEHFGTTLAVEGDPAGHLARLVDASVVAREQSPVGSRYLLLETVRAFALERAHRPRRAGRRRRGTGFLRREPGPPPRTRPHRTGRGGGRCPPAP